MSTMTVAGPPVSPAAAKPAGESASAETPGTDGTGTAFAEIVAAVVAASLLPVASPSTATPPGVSEDVPAGTPSAAESLPVLGGLPGAGLPAGAVSADVPAGTPPTPTQAAASGVPATSTVPPATTAAATATAPAAPAAPVAPVATSALTDPAVTLGAATGSPSAPAHSATTPATVNGQAGAQVGQPAIVVVPPSARPVASAGEAGQPAEPAPPGPLAAATATPPSPTPPGHAPAGTVPPTAPAQPSSYVQTPTPAAQVAAVIMPLRAEGDGVHRVVLQLHPEDLGQVQVRVELRGHELHLQLAGASDATRDVLRAALGDLRRDLAAQGFAATSLDVSPDSPGGGFGAYDGSGGDRRPSGGARLATGTAPASVAPALPIPSASSAAGIDVRV